MKLLALATMLTLCGAGCGGVEEPTPEQLGSDEQELVYCRAYNVGPVSATPQSYCNARGYKYGGQKSPGVYLCCVPLWV